MKLSRLIATCVAVALATPAAAGSWVAKPVQAEGQTIRFDQGTPTIEDDMPLAGVRVVPINQQLHGGMQFMVAVYNKSAKPVNVGVENVFMTFAGTRYACFTKDELAKKAKKKAFWQSVALAALAGAAAAAQNNDTTITTTTPHGIYHTVINRPGLSDGQIATIAAGGAGVAVTQVELQKTLASLNDEIVQTTTVDPNSGYGGRIVLQKLQKPKPGDQIVLDVDVGGEHHLFAFTLAKA